MNDNARIALFGGILLKYRFVEPVPAEIRERIRSVKRTQFKKTLRRAGGYSLLFALVSDVFFTLKKAGLPVTIVKSAVILGILSIIMTATLTSGIYLLVAGVVAEPDAIGETVERTEGDPAASGANAGDATGPAEAAAVIEDRIAVRPFAAVNMAGSRAAGVSDRIADSLAGLRGAERVVNLRFGRGGKKSGMMLFGSVEHVEGAYTVTARVVSVKDSRILFYDTRTVESEEEIEGAGDRLARRIYESLQ